MKQRSGSWGLVLGVALMTPVIVWGWGSTTVVQVFPTDAWATHQYIEGRAYAAVTNDPAFRDGDLPTIAQLRAVAGNTVGVVFNVTATGTNVELLATGDGPDAEGKSNYGDHWFNPAYEKGNAPEAVRKNICKWLSTDHIDIQAVDWAAHYLADMSTPVHMFGTTKDDILGQVAAVLAKAGRQPTQSLAGLTITLSQQITGPDGKVGRNWAYEVQAFRDKTKNAWVDYFDPWYYDTNGWAIVTLYGQEVFKQPTSSHAGWEFTVPVHDTKWSGAYHADWHNPKTPSFTAYQQDYGEKVYLLAKLAAVTTLGEYKDLAGYNTPAAIDRAIANVATLWRASFSALRAEVSSTLSGDVDNPDCYDVEALVTNAAATGVSGIELQFSLDGATLVKGEKSLKMGDLAGGGKTDKKDAAKWTIKTDDPQNCRIIIEMIGAYTVPDLQYRRQAFRLENYEPSNSLAFVIDATGSMAGQKLANAKETAIAEINKLGEDTEVAVISFSGCSDGVSVVSSFKRMTPKGKSAVCAAVNGIAAGDSTNLAEATGFAGNYTRNKGRGKIRRAMIVLTDGVETCNGDPAAAVKEVNTITRTETDL